MLPRKAVNTCRITPQLLEQITSFGGLLNQTLNGFPLWLAKFAIHIGAQELKVPFA
jgi:hypothetical protein